MKLHYKILISRRCKRVSVEVNVVEEGSCEGVLVVWGFYGVEFSLSTTSKGGENHDKSLFLLQRKGRDDKLFVASL